MSTSVSRSGAGARDQVARLLTLVPLLHHRDQVRLADAAALLDTTPEQLLGDLRVLFMCGLPGGLPDDLIDVDLDAIEAEEGLARPDGVIRVSNADYLARPLRLTPTEASAVIVALRALRESSSAATATIVDGALAKLEAAAASGSAARLVDVAAEPDEADLVSLADRLQGAAEARRQVRLRYLVPARDELSERVVDPRGVVAQGPFRYLDAWCHTADAPRLFRLDRVTGAEVLDTATTTEHVPPRDLTSGLVAGDPDGDAEIATLRLAPEARWVTEYYQVRAVREVGGGALEVDLPVADPRWLVRLLLRLAPHAVPLTPHDFTSSLHRSAAATLALYR